MVRPTVVKPYNRPLKRDQCLFFESFFAYNATDARSGSPRSFFSIRDPDGRTFRVQRFTNWLLASRYVFTFDADAHTFQRNINYSGLLRTDYFRPPEDDPCGRYRLHDREL